MNTIDNTFSFFFCKQNAAYEMRISDWSSDVCSSDLRISVISARICSLSRTSTTSLPTHSPRARVCFRNPLRRQHWSEPALQRFPLKYQRRQRSARLPCSALRSEEHTSELQSLMRISYAVFCLKKKKHITTTKYSHHTNTAFKDSN